MNLDALLYYISYSPLTYSAKGGCQLGLFYLAQYASDKGYSVKVDNLSSNDPIISKICNSIEESNCKIVGFYVDSENIWILRKVLQNIKKIHPEITLIVGGPQLTVAPEQTLQRLPEINFGIIGEGEYLFEKILGLKDFFSGTLNKIDGIVYRDSSGIHINSISTEIVDIEELKIPDRNFLSLSGEYKEHPKMITGRGCAGRCAFCYEGSSSKRSPVRVQSIEKCLREFDYLVETFKEYKYISIIDDNFISDPQRTEKFCRELIKRYNGNVKWFCEARVDILYRNLSLLPLLKEAGLLRLQIGGESGSQEVLNVYRKGSTVKQIIKVVEESYKAGLHTIYANFIIGGALESQNTFHETLSFSKELLQIAPGCMEVGGSIYSPYNGTPMFDNPIEYEINILDKEMITGSHGTYPFCSTKELEPYDIMRLFNEYNKSINETYAALLLDLTDKEIFKHYEAYYKYDIISRWYEVAAKNKILNNYYNSILLGNSSRFQDFTDEDLLTAYPFRTVNPIPLKNGKIGIVDYSGNIVESDNLVGNLLKLSSGKLSYSDILILLLSINPNLSQSELNKKVKAGFLDLDKMKAVVWKNLS